MRSPAVLIANPATDRAFVAFGRRLLQRGARTTSQLQAQLRERYPDAVVHRRELTGEPEMWYVYRDGHWISGDGEATAGQREEAKPNVRVGR